MMRWVFVLLISAAAGAQVGEVQGLGPTSRVKPPVPSDKPADPAAGRGATQAPAIAGRGAAQTPPAGRGGRGTPAPVAGAAVLPKDLKFPPLRAVQVPAITTATLSNGFKISL